MWFLSQENQQTPSEPAATPACRLARFVNHAMAWFSTISNKFPRLPGSAQEPEVALRAARHNNIDPARWNTPTSQIEDAEISQTFC
jgi:hypothetical protein